MTISVSSTSTNWAATAERGVRRLAAVTWAGGLVGLLVGGVGGRLAMMVLARLNPEAAGVTSDDGFTIGHLTPLTVNLLFVTTLLGVLGSGIYFVLRGLMVGPRWFQVLSISLGPAVVVGGVLVHVEGVDFTLEPVWLAIVMFVAIPGIYAALLTAIAERWLAPDRRFLAGNIWLALSPLVLWAPIAPALAVLVFVLVAFEAVRRTDTGRTLLAQPVWPWLARAALVGLFVLSLVQLTRDTVALV
ncbi:MAG TPA: hypothetical protein VK204_12070 [Nocardioidaceae bacterium]|nr:hypothetical protein [Nocardioidaceae bacterium]